MKSGLNTNLFSRVPTGLAGVLKFSVPPSATLKSGSTKNQVSQLAPQFLAPQVQAAFTSDLVPQFPVPSLATKPSSTTNMLPQFPARGGITNGLFNDDDWQKKLHGIEVQDLDDTWRVVSLFRHKTNTEHVCLWFGGNEYEGIDPLHPFACCSRTETLEDDEGYDIHWRVIGVENDTSDDDEEEED